MAKKSLKRGVALGALMAFVITGSAMAAEKIIDSGTYNNSNSVTLKTLLMGLTVRLKEIKSSEPFYDIDDNEYSGYIKIVDLFRSKLKELLYGGEKDTLKGSDINIKDQLLYIKDAKSNIKNIQDTEKKVSSSYDKIIKELDRVLKINGECYITLGSKDTWGFKQEDWPLVDPNTRLRMEEGPEYKTPHFYADYDLIKDLFCKFDIVNIRQEVEYNENNGKVYDSYHYHILIKKVK